MDINEMKNLWDDMSQQLAVQKKLTDKIIIDMTQVKYMNKFRTISTIETIGSLLCFGFFLFIALNISKLDTWYLLISGLICAGFYLFFPLLSLYSIYKLQRVNLSTDSYKETLIRFITRKKFFMQVQRIGIFLCFLMLVLCLPVAVKIMDNKDLFLESNVWIWYLPIGFTFLVFFSKWGYRSYGNVIQGAEVLLRDLRE